MGGPGRVGGSHPAALCEACLTSVWVGGRSDPGSSGCGGDLDDASHLTADEVNDPTQGKCWQCVNDGIIEHDVGTKL